MAFTIGLSYFVGISEKRSLSQEEWKVMPYLVGAGEPEWDEYLDLAENDLEPPKSLFKYGEPWIAGKTVLEFPETQGPQPTTRALDQTAKQLSPQQMFEKFQEEQKLVSDLARWRISGMCAKCRAAGIKRVRGGYDGGGDESFTYLWSVEMNDGRVIPAGATHGQIAGVDCQRLVEDAAFAIMGSFDAGEFILRGALIIDFEACTITDVNDVEVVFGATSDT